MKLKVIDNFFSDQWCLAFFGEAYFGSWCLSGKTANIPSLHTNLTWVSWPNEKNEYVIEYREKLTQTVSEFLDNDDYKVRQWFTGATVGMHTGNHFDAKEEDSISSIFYLHSMSEDEGGANIFYDHDGKPFHRQQPKAGTLVLFHGNVGHDSVPPTFLYHNKIGIILNTLYYPPDSKNNPYD